LRKSSIHKKRESEIAKSNAQKLGDLFSAKKRRKATAAMPPKAAVDKAKQKERETWPSENLVTCFCWGQ